MVKRLGLLSCLFLMLNLFSPNPVSIEANELPQSNQIIQSDCDNHETPINAELPTPALGKSPTTGREIKEEAFSGPTWIKHDERLNSDCANDQPNHAASAMHFHFADAITGRWDGFYTIDLGRGCVGPCTLSASESQTWSHKFGVSIGFDKAPIKGTVGYDVTYSSSQTFTYSFPVAAGERKVVKYDDFYHITDMNVHTDWYTCAILGGGTCFFSHREDGTAWAGQWFTRIFKSVPF
ncbi:hypothetical protein [Herpetosiphon sp. NSE202]|uniref:hypothetical protein n=1 Tax=Herpetosiphon sp. NSE202 TaxID=3351349 RepID=UPI0036381345